MLSANDLAAMRAVQETAMMDTCVVLTRKETSVNSFGLPDVRYVEGEAIACGFNPKNTKNVLVGTNLAVTDGEFRLPLGTTISANDRIRLTHRYGSALASAQTYDVVGEPIQGPSAVVVYVRLAANLT